MKEINNKYCLKPNVYYTLDSCEENFENFDNVCIPKCPYGWKDLG